MYLIQGDYQKIINYCQDIFENNFFEFEIPFVPETQKFREIDRFLYESRHTLRFKNEYEGNIVIDISEWNKTETNSYFDAFIFFIKDNPVKYNCALIMDERCNDELLIKLKSLFNLRSIELELPQVKEKTKIGFALESKNREDKNNV